MKYLILLMFVMFCSLPTFALELAFGLDTQKPEQKRKPIVLLYFANDRITPVRSDLDKTLLYLTTGLRGEQFQFESENILTEEELAFHQALSTENKSFLRNLGDFVSRDIRQDIESWQFDAIKNNTVGKSPRYPMSFYAYRNFMQSYSLQEESPLLVQLLRMNDEAVNPHAGVISTQMPEEAFTFPYRDQPISHPGVLERVIEDAMLKFPPDEYRYLLVIRSPAATGMAISPRYEVLAHSDFTYQELLETLIEKKDILLQGDAIPPLNRKTQRLLSEILSELAGRKDRKGTTLEELFSFLGRSSGEFPLVFLDVNEVEIPKELQDPQTLPNVGTLFYTKSTSSDLIDYRDLFSYLGVKETTFEDRLRNYLRKHLP